MAQETSRARMLFVDDEESIRLTLPRIFARHGFEVTSVATLENALAVIQAEKFDALLCDLKLREVNSGFTIIEEMRKAQPGCIVFILTGNPSQESFQKAAGRVARYFIKPVDIEEMVNVIKRKLAPRHSPAATPQANPSPQLKYPWQRAMLETYTELRPEQLMRKINAAHRAISARLCHLTPTDLEEQAAIRAALRSLRVLLPEPERKEPSMEYPEWQRSLLEAVTELDHHELIEKVRIAELAIREKLKNSHSLSRPEKEALRDGLLTLATLMTPTESKRERRDAKKEIA